LVYMYDAAPYAGSRQSLDANADEETQEWGAGSSYLCHVGNFVATTGDGDGTGLVLSALGKKEVKLVSLHP